MNSLLNKYLVLYPVYLVRFELFRYLRSLGKFVKICDIDEDIKLKIRSMVEKADLSYYGNVFFAPDHLNRLGRIDTFLKSFPLMDKASARGYGFSCRPSEYSFLDKRSTSGSTGEPFEFYKDRASTAVMDAIQTMAFSWHGIDPGDKQARFWGMPSGKNRRIALLKDFVKNRIRFSAFDLSAERMSRFYKKMLRFTPSYFYGYPSLILEFGRFLKKRNLSLAQIPLKAIIGTGEYVAQGERQEFLDLFNLPLVSEYGCTETGVIGFECPSGNMHLMSPNIYLEVIDENGNEVHQGDEGEFVVTELNALYKPFIRYRLGDRGRKFKAACPCGCKYPVIEVSSGRKDDYIITPEGEKIYDAILAYTLKKGVQKFKATQISVNTLSIDIIPNSDFTQLLRDHYIAELKHRISHKMMIDIHLVEKIERDRSGKLRYFKPLE